MVQVDTQDCYVARPDIVLLWLLLYWNIINRSTVHGKTEIKNGNQKVTDRLYKIFSRFWIFEILNFRDFDFRDFDFREFDFRDFEFRDFEFRDFDRNSQWVREWMKRKWMITKAYFAMSVSQYVSISRRSRVIDFTEPVFLKDVHFLQTFANEWKLVRKIRLLRYLIR
jgi:hypothetical protein